MGAPRAEPLVLTVRVEHEAKDDAWHAVVQAPAGFCPEGDRAAGAWSYERGEALRHAISRAMHWVWLVVRETGRAEPRAILIDIVDEPEGR